MTTSDDEQQQPDLAELLTGDALPAMAEAEAGWPGHVRGRPVTGLLGEDSALRTFLASPGEPAEGLTRAERAQFWEQRRAAEQEARDAVADAMTYHAQMKNLLEQQQAADALDGRLAIAAKRQQEGTRVPVKGPNQPAIGGRW